MLSLRRKINFTDNDLKKNFSISWIIDYMRTNIFKVMFLFLKITQLNLKNSSKGLPFESTVEVLRRQPDVVVVPGSVLGFVLQQGRGSRPRGRHISRIHLQLQLRLQELFLHFSICKRNREEIVQIKSTFFLSLLL